MASAHDATLLLAGAAGAMTCLWLRERYWNTPNPPKTAAFAAAGNAGAGSVLAGNVTVTLREATRADIPNLRRLEQGVVAAERPFCTTIRPYDEAQPVIYYDLEHLIDNDQSRLLVAEHEETVVATAYLTIRESKPCQTHSQHGYLGFMFVARILRGKGLNRLIMESLIEWGQGQGVEHFYLDVYSNNDPAVRAYEKAGFSNLLYEMHAHLPLGAP